MKESRPGLSAARIAAFTLVRIGAVLLARSEPSATPGIPQAEAGV